MKNKISKNKIIITVLSVALIGTSTVAGIKVNKVRNDSKGAQSNMIVTEEVKEQKNITQEPTAHKSTTQKKATKSKTTSNIKSKTKEVKSETSTSTTKPSEKRTVPINKALKDSRGRVLTFVDAEIEGNMIIININLHNSSENAMTAYHAYNINTKEIIFTSNNGAKMKCPDNRRYKSYLTANAKKDNTGDVTTGIILGYDDSITSITASYTFDDGTKGIVVISLK